MKKATPATPASITGRVNVSEPARRDRYTAVRPRLLATRPNRTSAPEAQRQARRGRHQSTPRRPPWKATRGQPAPAPAPPRVRAGAEQRGPDGGQERRTLARRSARRAVER